MKGYLDGMHVDFKEDNVARYILLERLKEKLNFYKEEMPKLEEAIQKLEQLKTSEEE